MVLVVILASAGALRLGSGIGAALANSTAEKAAAPLNCPTPPAALAAALAGREAQVKSQEQALAERMSALSLADQAITKRMAELQVAEGELKKTLAIADGASEKDLSQLTAVYEAMKPADAATLFQTMAPEFAAGFLGRMQPASAAAIMTGMKPDKAYQVSVLLAGRNALAPKN
jgi:flagellar motility protein MotE (MotC chaperone)